MACPSGKIPHADREVALEHQKKLVYKNHLSGQSERSKGLNVYPCPECPAWHVGHTDERVPLVYHYTVGLGFDRILQAGVLRPRRPDALSAAINERDPLLWFSWNPHWEYSVTKGAPQLPAWRASAELYGEGLYRWGAPASVARLRWNDYLARNRTSFLDREGMAQYGNPAEWLATDQPVALSDCRSVEAYYRGQWTADISDEDFDSYLAERPAVYDAAEKRLYEKVAAAVKHGDVILKAIKGLFIETMPHAQMQELHEIAPDLLKILWPDDEAEAILLEDYRGNVKRLGWHLRHWDSLQKFATMQRHYQRVLREAKKRKRRRK